MSRNHVCAIRLLVTALAIVPAAATVVVPVGGCVGLNTSFCPGFIESFVGSPGTFITGKTLDAATAEFSGLLAAAVFLNSNGTTLDFYYQFKNDASSTKAIN